MIKAVDINEIPNIIRRGETCYDIEQFLDSDTKCCEIEVNDSTAEKTRGRYYFTARRMKAPVKFAVRGNRVFMIKKENI